MILDDEGQRKILLEMMDGTSFPGRLLEAALVLKKAIVSAEVIHQSVIGQLKDMMQEVKDKAASTGYKEEQEEK